MNFILSYLVQLIIFGLALFFGSQFTGSGLNSDWYKNLLLPPWQPAGWVFGAAWTTIMLTFSAAIAIVIPYNKVFSFESNFVKVFWIQIVLNVAWNILFFKFNFTLFSFLEIIALLVLVVLISIKSFSYSTLSGILCLPYAIWLLIACSLNGYIWIKN
jgi:tryptophan-rich sensory protein